MAFYSPHPDTGIPQGILGISGRALTATITVLSLLTPAGSAQPLPRVLAAKVEAKAKQFQTWSTDPFIVAAVKARNAGPKIAMTQEKWKTLSDLDPFVLSLSGNALGVYLKGKRDPQITECFVSAADGAKVAFLSKPTNWSHSAQDKHKVPMTGKIYIGPALVDESTTRVQVQIGLPVLDQGKPIGSIIIGIAVLQL